MAPVEHIGETEAQRGHPANAVELRFPSRSVWLSPTSALHVSHTVTCQDMHTQLTVTWEPRSFHPT